MDERRRGRKKAQKGKYYGDERKQETQGKKRRAPCVVRKRLPARAQVLLRCSLLNGLSLGAKHLKTLFV